MKSKINFLSVAARVFALFVFLLQSNSSDAQENSNNQNTPWPKPSVSPTILNLLHGIDLKARFAEMKRNGLSTSNFILKTSGSLWNDDSWDISEKSTKDFYELGRETGANAISYEVALGLDGNQKQLSITGIEIKNGKALNEYRLAHGNEYDAYHPAISSIFDGVKLFSVTWDHHYSYQDLKLFDFMLVKIDPNFTLFKKELSSLNLRGSADIGWRHMSFKQADGSQIEVGGSNWRIVKAGENYVNIGDAFRTNYSIGLEFNRNEPGGNRLSVQAGYRGG